MKAVAVATVVVAVTKSFCKEVQNKQAAHCFQLRGLFVFPALTRRIIRTMENITDTLAQLRREYVSEPLTEAAVAADPIEQFKHWFQAALAAEQPDAEAMTLSTAAHGRVAGRIVLLKGCDERGFVFFTNYDSRKGQELAAHPQAALTFYWHTLNRQVRIEGQIEKVPAGESASYFQTRPRGSQIGAWASPQSRELVSREVLEQRVAELTQQFETEPLVCPPFWGGYLLRPDHVEFWQGRESRLHDRIVYSLQTGVWQINRLAP